MPQAPVDHAPVLLFVYSRLTHTQQTVSALQRNDGAQDTELYIFSDAPKHDGVATQVQEIRDYIRGIRGFRRVTLVERTHNLGLAGSIIAGVSEALESHDRVIVLEDDLITAPGFLRFMNGALEHFSLDRRIISVSGFSFARDYLTQVTQKEADIFFHPRPMSWSWATWRDRWAGVDWEIKDYQAFTRNSNAKKKLRIGGSDLVKMLDMQMNGHLDSWYIRWCYHALHLEQWTVYPRVSLVRNIGHDGTGVHCGPDAENIFSHSDMSEKRVFSFDTPVVPELGLIRRFNAAFAPPLAVRARRLANRIVRRCRKGWSFR